jgi:predicted methyltransferase
MIRTATGAALLLALSMVSTLGSAAVTGTDPVSIAVNDPTRTEADRTRDERDHTIDVLKFFGVAPGMTVVDLFAGGGYFSEVIGRIVGGGSSGKVYMHNNAAYQTFIGDALTERVKGGRLQNVVKLDAEIGQLGIPPASVDLVLMSMSYHDLYFKADDWAVDPKAVFTEVHAMLKPGGTLAIIDHSAIAGTGSSPAQTLHRIDEAFARSDIEARGFKFTGSLDVLHNPADDRTKTVFDPAVRGHTDRFVYRFVRD